MRGQTWADNSKVRGWGSFPKLAEQTHNSQTHTSLDLDGGRKGMRRGFTMRWITAMHCADEQNLLFAFSPDQVDQVDQVDQADQVNELGIKTGEATGVRGVSGSFMGRVCRRWRPHSSYLQII